MPYSKCIVLFRRFCRQLLGPGSSFLTIDFAWRCSRFLRSSHLAQCTAVRIRQDHQLPLRKSMWFSIACRGIIIINTAWNRVHSTVYVIGQRETHLANYIITSSKALDPATQSWTHTKKKHHVKANFIHINDIFFSQRTKNATYLIFPFIWRPVESKTERK